MTRTSHYIERYYDRYGLYRIFPRFFRDAGVAELCTAGLARAPGLRELVLRRNRVGPAGLAAFSSFRAGPPGALKRP